MPFLNEQLQFIYWIQEIRNPIVDGILYGLNFFDTDYYICSLIAFVWIGCSWKWGIRLGYLLIASGLVNALIKLAFALPRPFFFDPSLAIVKLHDYGFPSGGAQNALLLGALLIYYWKNRWAWPVALSYILVVSVSRMLLGVHFPMDVLGGWILGAAIFYAFIRWDRFIEEWVSRQPKAALGAVIAFAIVVLCLLRDFKTVFMMSSLIPMSIGVYFSTRYDWYFTPPTEMWKKIALGFFGVISAAICTGLVKLIPLPMMSSLILQISTSAIWLSLAASPFCKKVFLKETLNNSSF